MILTDEDGKKWEVRCGPVGTTPNVWENIELVTGDLIVRPLPPPAKTVEDALPAMYDAFRKYHGQAATLGALDDAVQALIAAVRAEERAK